ncbi:hypothetical protein APB27_31490 [Pseudomonas aeruginosa]|uniref:Uncharacterized protein n=1 Tax=Pseudomonas paraeruginosa TaxID=2994495 RepID=A0A2R3IQG6_9PSED|nr:hypothetical protein CSB93_6466 [Pseudomonas paraeruginosa]KAB0752287.1 hypothetical protein F7O94_02030 [Pseudomonas aeruginosa]AVR69693.1 hypothetical protein B7D75_23265 [Pseudomonas paraeruginosa]AWE91246.1 hypothetical protein CSC28_5269 [Pseudomonas paraeruginosa]MCO3127334.1 hypothetical protein [Pseudomonas aeruginosa]
MVRLLPKACRRVSPACRQPPPVHPARSPSASAAAPGERNELAAMSGGRRLASRRSLVVST